MYDQVGGKRLLRHISLGVVLLMHVLLFWLVTGGQTLPPVPAPTLGSAVTVVLLEPAARQPGGQSAAPVPMPVTPPPPLLVPPIVPVVVAREAIMAVPPTPVAPALVAAAPGPALAQGAGDGLGTSGDGPGAGEGGSFQTISSGVEYLRKPVLEYPPKARREHEEGDTLMRVLVSEEGLPLRASVEKSSGSARLDAAAHQAVMGALFKPFVSNGKAFSVYALVPIRFRLSRE